jgi:hypothetical protein
LYYISIAIHKQILEQVRLFNSYLIEKEVGTTEGLIIRGQQTVTSFKSNLALLCDFKDTSSCQLYEWNSTWIEVASNNNVTSNSPMFVEGYLSRDALGNGPRVYVCGGLVQQGLIFSMTPAKGNSDGINVTFNSYWGFPLIDAMYSSFEGLINSYPTYAVLSGSFQNSTIWQGSLIPPESASACIPPGITITVNSASSIGSLINFGVVSVTDYLTFGASGISLLTFYVDNNPIY